MEYKIDNLGDEESKLTSSDSKDSSRNSHFRFHKNMASLTGHKKFKTDREYSVNIPVVITPKGVVLQQ